MKDELEVMFEMAKEASKKDAEIERLRELLRKCLPCLMHSTALPLYDEVAQEVGNE